MRYPRTVEYWTQGSLAHLRENAVLRRTLFEALPVLSFGVLLTNCASPFKKTLIDVFSAPQDAGGQTVPFVDTGRQAINTPEIGRVIGDTKTATWQDLSIVSSAENKAALTVLSSQTLVLFRAAVGGSDYRGYQGCSLTATARGWYSDLGIPWSATLLDPQHQPIDRWSDASPVAVACLDQPNFWRRAINPDLFNLTEFAYISYTGGILFHQC
jgi:hypothetical protein